MNKKEVASILKSIGTLQEIKGENEFKVRAYYNGAKIIENLDDDIVELVKDNKLKDIKGIGKALTEKITEFVNTGKLDYYARLVQDTPGEIFEFLKIPGLGPKKVREIYYNMGIMTLGELEYACNENRLVNYKGFGMKTQNKIAEGIRNIKKHIGKLLYSEANEIAHNILAYLSNLEMVIESAISGEIRRKMEFVSAIDIVLSTEYKDDLKQAVKDSGILLKIHNDGEDTICGLSEYGIVLNVHISFPEKYVFALFETTGSIEHVESVKRRGDSESLSDVRDEAEIYKKCGMDYIEPELREDRGEQEAALGGCLPRLVSSRDIKGVFHLHTAYSDGINTIEEMAGTAKAMGFSYIGIGDHSKSSFYARGLTEKDVRRQLYEISVFNDNNRNMRIFKGIECNILEDGSLDYDDSILEIFDYVVASIHSGFGMSEHRMTERIKRAMGNKYVTMLGHLTGRLLLSREGYRLNIDEVIKTAVSYGKIIEINASPFRLDMDWRLIKDARNMGARFVINPDAHSVQGIYDTIYGVNIARKGWLEPGDLINTMETNEVERFLKQNS